MAKKAREPGRFVTLRSGRVIFIPKGYKSKWADVRERVLAGKEGRAFEPDDPVAFERDVERFGEERARARSELRRQRGKELAEIRAREGRQRPAERVPEAAEKRPSVGTAAVRDLLHEGAARYGFTWNGKLYKAGGGDYYAIDRESAEMYARLGPVREYNFPSVKKPLTVDIDAGGIGVVERYAGEKFEDVGDVGLLIEGALSGIKAAGYDSVVIMGETGPDIWGTPVEFVDLRGKTARG